jgi:hypothetical protein
MHLIAKRRGSATARLRRSRALAVHAMMITPEVFYSSSDLSLSEEDEPFFCAAIASLLSATTTPDE